MTTVHVHPSAGYPTEYTENYTRKDPLDTRITPATTVQQIRELERTLQRSAHNQTVPVHPSLRPFTQAPQQLEETAPPAHCDPKLFESQDYSSIYRDPTLRKDDRGNYINPFRNVITKPYGRRLRYDQTHPDSIYPSQWSSELADDSSLYSFPTPTGLVAEVPWTRNLQWQANGEVGNWPTEKWSEWNRVAQCPPYESYTDQTIYSRYKVQVPPQGCPQPSSHCCGAPQTIRH